MRLSPTIYRDAIARESTPTHAAIEVITVIQLQIERFSAILVRAVVLR